MDTRIEKGRHNRIYTLQKKYQEIQKIQSFNVIDWNLLQAFVIRDDKESTWSEKIWGPKNLHLQKRSNKKSQKGYFEGDA